MDRGDEVDDVEDGKAADRERITKFVMGLFHNVMDIPDPPETWTQPWIERALKVGDPLTIFDQFVAQKANTDRRIWREDTATRWPAGHFYSPVVSKSELAADWPRLERNRAPVAVDLRKEPQRALLMSLSLYFNTLD